MVQIGFHAGRKEKGTAAIGAAKTDFQKSVSRRIHGRLNTNFPRVFGRSGSIGEAVFLVPAERHPVPSLLLHGGRAGQPVEI